METAKQKDQNGFVTIIRNPISRAGVFQYSGRSLPDADPSKIYSVYRPAEELSDPEALKSFKMMPIIDEHVMLGEGYATAPEEKGVHGSTGEDVTFEDNVLYTNLRIFSQTLKNLIDAGKKGLSMGYRCVYEKSVGTFNGMNYDYIQRNIRGNHLALVNEGRCNVAVLDHHVAFDHFDLALDTKEQVMENENKEIVKDEGEKEMTLSEAVALIKSIVPQVQAMTEALAAKAETKEEVVETALDADKEDGEAKDADEKKDEKKDEAMDQIDVLKSQVATLMKRGTKEVLAEVSQRDKLARDVSAVIGTFDHAEMTAGEVAVYAVEKLGITAPKGQELATLNGYFAGAKVKSNVGFAMDAKAKTGGKLAKRLNAQA